MNQEETKIYMDSLVATLPAMEAFTAGQEVYYRRRNSADNWIRVVDPMWLTAELEYHVEIPVPPTPRECYRIEDKHGRLSGMSSDTPFAAVKEGDTLIKFVEKFPG